MSRVLLALIRLYQLTFSSFMGTECRFRPTCSYYMADAIHKYGATRGVILGAGRVCRCHPWNPGGVDPVPSKVFLGRKPRDVIEGATFQQSETQ